MRDLIADKAVCLKCQLIWLSEEMPTFIAASRSLIPLARFAWYRSDMPSVAPPSVSGA